MDVNSKDSVVIIVNTDTVLRPYKQISLVSEHYKSAHLNLDLINVFFAQHGSRLGVCQLLNNFGVMDFNQDEPLNKMQSRWSDTSTVLCNILGEDSIPGLPRKNVKGIYTTLN